MAVKLLFNELPQFVDANGDPYSGAKLFTYVAGSSTKQTTYQDSGAITANSNPIVCDSAGRVPYPIWGTTGVSYKLVLAPSTDTDPPTSPIFTIDNVTGINDTTVSIDQWVSGPTPTYVSATSFTLAGDQTSTFQVGRRVKTTNSGGTVYSTITGSAFGALTTVTVVNDSGSLDSGLSAVSYALLTSQNASVPGLTNIADVAILSAVGTVRGASAPNEPVNLTLAASASGNALTISIKTRSGADPSPASPVFIPFRNATATTGDYSWLVLISATSLTLSNGSTLGTVANIPNRVWIVAFNDAGTCRLGAINCVGTAAGGGAGRDVTILFQVRNYMIASSTAEGGAGGADSNSTFYTGTAVTSKALCVLGYFEYSSGLGTAGVYATAPTTLQLYSPGGALPGDEISVRRTVSGNSGTGTTTIPFDNTIPQITEGDEYMTVAIAPTSTMNVLRIKARGIFANSGAGAATIIAALFQDATANALAATSQQYQTAGATLNLNIDHFMLAQTTSATTFRLRAGGGSAGTTTWNGSGGSQLFSGVYNSFIEVSEIMG